MTARPALLLALLTLLLTGCADGVAGPPLEGPVSFETLAQDTNGSYDIETRENLVIRSRADFRAFWQTLHSRQSPEPPLPDVDFAESTVVAVLFGVKPTSGYAIEVEAVQAGPRVSVREVNPGPACGLFQVLTSPYHVIRIDVPADDVSFSSAAQTRTCN